MIVSCGALFYPGSPEISLAGSIFGSTRVPLALVELDNDQFSDSTWLEGLENIKYRIGKQSPKFSQKP